MFELAQDFRDFGRGAPPSDRVRQALKEMLRSVQPADPDRWPGDATTMIEESRIALAAWYGLRPLSLAEDSGVTTATLDWLASQVNPDIAEKWAREGIKAT